jgi:hypothetical protein
MQLNNKALYLIVIYRSWIAQRVDSNNLLVKAQVQNGHLRSMHASKLLSC